MEAISKTSFDSSFWREHNLSIINDVSIVNGTSHEINIFDEKDTIVIQGGRKRVIAEGAKPVFVIQSGTDLNGQKDNKSLPEHLKNTGLPMKGATIFIGYDPVPESGDIVVVSQLYKSAVASLGGDTSRLATVDGSVYASESDLRPCGCVSLSVG